MRRSTLRGALVATLLILTALTMTLSGPLTASPANAQNVSLVLYNAQHQALAEAWAAAFEQQTGIKVEIRQGSDLSLANQLVQEGDSSPADVFITENSPAMSLVGNAGMFAPVDQATRDQVPAQWSSPNGDWVGIAARTTVFVYNPSMLSADQLPKSILDLAKPEWQDRFGIAAAGADFQAIVSAVLQLTGPEETQTWLNGLKQNARIYSGNRGIMTAANKGEIPGGVIYHYYWYGDRAESGANSSNVELHYFMGKDPGGFVSVSGGGVLKSSQHPAEAQQLLNFMTSKAGQQVLSDSKALEYSIASDVAPNPALKPLSELDPPTVDLSQLNAPMVIELMQKAGLL
jgi:iron(III) transport system substrate-binding protein